LRNILARLRGAHSIQMFGGGGKRMEGIWIGVGVFMSLNAILWIAQFMDLMTMPDNEFPGRFDKALWVLVFVALFVLVAPIAFGLWKERNRRRLRTQREASAEPAAAADRGRDSGSSAFTGSARGPGG
jgi:hypothetical protein